MGDRHGGSAPRPDLLWFLADRLSGSTLLGAEEAGPLGGLPHPIRTCVIQSLAKLAPESVQIETESINLAYSPRVFQRIAQCRYTDPGFGETLRDRDSIHTPLYSSVDAYCDHHRLMPPENGSDEHYAERMFLNEVFLPVFGLVGLKRLHPQVEFRKPGDGTGRVDFVLVGGKHRYAIEIEGQTYHSGAQRFDDEKARQRALLAADMVYLPYSFEDLRSGRALESLRTLVGQDGLLDKVVAARFAAPTGDRMLAALFGTFLSRFWDAQRLALAALRTATAAGRAEITVIERAPSIPVLALAFLDIVPLVGHVADLYGLQVALPQVIFKVVDPLDRRVCEVILGHAASLADGESRVDVGIVHESGTGPFDLVSDLDEQSGPNSRGASSWHDLEARAHDFERSLRPAGVAGLLPVCWERPALDYFARRFFSIPEIKPEQLTLIQRLLAGKPTIGILPTGYGKSLVFQLAAMLAQRTLLVISPLTSLIRDQVHGLRRLGLRAVEALVGSDSAVQKSEKLDRLRTRRLRLLYVSPERLLIRSFYDELRANIAREQLGALVIDEVHCVSEWGHDFRPAYLQIPRLRQELSAVAGFEIPIIGLTATASLAVREDILRTLELPTDSVVQLASADRPNLSISVHPVLRGMTKAEVVGELVRRHIPKILGSPHDVWRSDDAVHGFRSAGVIFAMFANPHGRTTLPEGTEEIAARLRDYLHVERDLVRTHASTEATVCPNCESHRYFYQQSKGKQVPRPKTHPCRFHCEDCGAEFDAPVQEEPDWIQAIQERQDGFKDDAFPILVATKGYGMGVDKGNIRFVVHHSFSSGLEGYYQEAGRAGRDGRHAHVALVHAPPTDECWAGHLASREDPPCISVAENFQFDRCPFGLELLCDYGRQMRFVKEAYPGVDQDAARVGEVYQRLVRDPHLHESRAADERPEGLQLPLYRLQQLGLVQTFTVTYQGHHDIRYHLEFDRNWSAQELVERVEKQLASLAPELGLAVIRKRVALLESLTGDLGTAGRGGDPPAELPLILEAARCLLRVIYVKIRGMRTEMLHAELVFARNDANEPPVCRRVAILKRFNVAAHTPDDLYRCEFCDVCVPDLHFESGRRAKVPVANAELDYLVRLIPDLMKSFDAGRLASVAGELIQRKATIGPLAQVTAQLEVDPGNLAALYMAGTLSRSRQGSGRTALSYFRSGYEEAERRSSTTETLRAFYSEAAQIDPQEAFRWVAKRGGAFDDPSGHEWLFDEASRSLGGQSQESRAMQFHRHVRKLGAVEDRLSADILPWVARLKQLHCDVIGESRNKARESDGESTD